ncbi:MAG: hypothetical protein HQL69_17375 [Magnetococcales bacterium]|nr:hypothetical protein [Magnetococcales bacterium]
MNKKLFAITILSIAITTPVWAAEQVSETTIDDGRAVCERYAEEDGVPAAKMAGYMALCIEEIKGHIGVDLSMDNDSEPVAESYEVEEEYVTDQDDQDAER